MEYQEQARPGAPEAQLDPTLYAFGLLAEKWKWESLPHPDDEMAQHWAILADREGDPVVLQCNDDFLMTETGQGLEELTPENPIAKALLALPMLIDVLVDIANHDDRPRQRKMVVEALAAVGY